MTFRTRLAPQVVAAPPAAGAIGWNFRRTAGYVTDVSPDLFSGARQNVTYPQSYDNGILSLQAGQEGSQSSFDWDEVVQDPRISGYHQQGGGSSRFWRITPGAGTWRTWFIAGNATTATQCQLWIYDGIWNSGEILRHSFATVAPQAGEYANVQGEVKTTANVIADYDTDFVDILVTTSDLTLRYACSFLQHIRIEQQ